MHIPYIRLFTLHALSANSSLKPCIKSTQVNFSQNPSESLKIYFICKIVSNLRTKIFSRFWYPREHSGKWMHAEKIWYTVYNIDNTWWSLVVTNLYILRVTAAVAQWVRAFEPQGEGSVFGSQSRQTKVVKSGSDSSTAKRSAIVWVLRVLEMTIISGRPMPQWVWHA